MMTPPADLDPQVPYPSGSGMTRRLATGLGLLWLAISLPFVLLYLTSRQVVINEVRTHVTGVAMAVAASLDADDFLAVRGAEDAGGAAYRRIQKLIDRVSQGNPDIRFVYTMRRRVEPFVPAYDYEFVVDQSPRDFNGNGRIDADEHSELPGKRYDASHLPALIAAWDHPGADDRITPDPPYPDLLSGYAPVTDAEGKTVAVVGVDVTAATVQQKLLAIQLVMTVVWLVLGGLSTLVLHLYYLQRDAFERVRLLGDEVERRNRLLRAANQELGQRNDRFQRELQLAQAVQLGFLPKHFPRQDRLVFDKYYLTCAMLGGDLFDVFEIDEDHVGLFIADVAGHGVSAALISSLLKMAVGSVLENGRGVPDAFHINLREPAAVLTGLNRLLVPEMPESDFVTVLYAVIDLVENQVDLASAGHPAPAHYQRRGDRSSLLTCPPGVALGVLAGADYQSIRVQVETGDKLFFFTDGLLEAMNAGGEPFGAERFLDVLGRKGGKPLRETVVAVQEEVALHRGGNDVSDDFSLLAVEIK